ncbi:geranylgeranyl transferase type-2 subunit alpha [Biomphalaria pfeifferi]|uniref:Geranylgeranyl transferase type-2 subunit alpha n=1 Tax=Biomphalaria pfeifferi TaxID=112525 RepID=A0AAD8AQR5_BIOPF|nr:geranylgeranyl transferase type-2 subunit alpha [Biomphalaria pfeifferi]
MFICSKRFCNDLNWQYRADNLTFPKDCDLKVTLVQGSLELCSSSLHLGENDSSLSGSSVTSMDKSIFSQEMSPLKKDTLLQAMESVLQLMEMESDNKWTVLTVVLLMTALDPDSYFDQIMCYLDKLEDLDGKRIHYYKDLRSKFIIENIFAGMELTNASTITLSGRSLTKMYHTELLPLVTSLDLCDNLLRDVHEFNLLQNVKVLNVANNKLENCEGLQHLPKLERLLLNGNNLTKSSDLLQLTTCAKLNFLDISDNPLSCQEEVIQTITALLPNVSICFKQQ